MTSPDQIRARVREVMPSVRSDLEALVRIPSVSADPARADDVRRSAEATAELFRGEGFEDVQILTAAGGAPAVVARKPAPEGAPTVLLYAHHDVQPVGDPADWDSEPLLIEGEEEVGSPTLEAFLAEHQHLLAADVIVIADSGNWDIGEPALTTSLRGLVDCFVEVRTLTHGVHSGMWGGAVPDAVTAMVRLLATLHDDNGDVAVEGLVHGKAADVDYPLDRVRAEAGMVDGLELIGTGSVVDRIWTKPAIATIGMDITSTANASNTLIPAVKAKLSVRLAPGDNAKRAMKAVEDHLRKHVPWGAQLTFTPGELGEPTQIDATGPAYDAARAAFKEAWDGVEPIDMGVGGSIPFIAAFREAFPKASVLVTGVEDPDTRAHGANEGLHLAEFERVCIAEALLLHNLAQ